MNRKRSRFLAALTAVLVAATGAVADTTAGAEPGELSSRGMHVIAAVDSNRAVPAGGDIPFGIPFAHSVKVSGDYSVVLDGVSALRSGQIAVGYLIGCAVDLSNGFTIGISPGVGVDASITPFVSLDGAVNLEMDAPPSVTIGGSVGIQPTVGVEADVELGLDVTLAPGIVTAVVIGVANLDEDAMFPYTFAHSNTPLNINSCLPVASAIPFVTVRADARNGSVQTTGYGTQFVF
ncbi:MspA family porin [Nocardia sp. NPDC049190]|uniref:MspA family porin n=1 Tax=Nocardia sp. NPDC049190 TaxID=3155650 RepID=UPI0033D56910